MPHSIIVGKRDVELLKLLEMTPATTAQIRLASVTFGDEPFRDDRRTRERLRTLADAGLVRSWPAPVSTAGVMHYHRLTTEGHRMLHPGDPSVPHRGMIAELAPSRVPHALATADVIVQVLVVAQRSGVRVTQFHGDGRLTLTIGEYRQQPDCHFQLEHAGRTFNVLFEIDRGTEPLDARREQSIRTKLMGYEMYQSWVLDCWRKQGSRGSRPGFRVAFLTTGATRANHILWLARSLSRNLDRRLVYAATLDEFLAEPRALTSPLFNDHHGRWQALVNSQPTSRFTREPIRLSRPLKVSPLGIMTPSIANAKSV